MHDATSSPFVNVVGVRTRWKVSRPFEHFITTVWSHMVVHVFVGVHRHVPIVPIIFTPPPVPKGRFVLVTA